MVPLRFLALLGGMLLLAPAAVDAKITVFTDESGKVHINNQGPEAAPPPEPNPASLRRTRERRPTPLPSPPVVEQEPAEEPEPPPPPPPPSGRRNATSLETSELIRPVSHEAVTAVSSSPPPARRASTPAAGTEPIRVGLNDEGVLVITNLPERAPTPEVPPTPNLAGSGRLVVPDGPVAWEETPVAGLIRPVAHQSRKGAQPGRRALETGAIRRHRDADGVIRISNVSPAPSPSPLASPLRRPEGVVPVVQAPARPGPSSRPLVVRRDNKGRLQIYTKEPEPPLLAALPPAGTLTRLDPAIAPIVAEASRAYQLPPSLILSVIRLESNFVPHAVSPKGAMGLMQLMPGTAADLGVQEPFCPRQNIMGGSRYLRHLLNSFDGSLPLAVAAYNAGPQRVVQAGHQVPEIKETKQFVSQVLGLYTLLEKAGPSRRP